MEACHCSDLGLRSGGRKSSSDILPPDAKPACLDSLNSNLEQRISEAPPWLPHTQSAWQESPTVGVQEREEHVGVKVGLGKQSHSPGPGGGPAS